MLNLFQHLIKSKTYETLKQVQGDKKRIATQSLKGRNIPPLRLRGGKGELLLRYGTGMTILTNATIYGQTPNGHLRIAFRRREIPKWKSMREKISQR